MMVLYGKKTWWMLRPEILDATLSTVESGHDNERIDVTPLSHPHLPWMRADLYPGDVLIVPPFVWHMVLSDPDGIAHAAMCRVHFVIFSVHIVRMQCAHGQTAGQQLSGSVCMM
jgi:ribosomal protein L16 Arg81 hydroxylase